MRFYGVDVLDYYRDPRTLSLRRLSVLVRGLPADAATVRAQHTEALWAPADYLLAAVLDTLRNANWLTIELNKKRGVKNPRPDPVPRPGDAQRQQREKTTRARLVSGTELSDWLAKVG